MLKAKALLPALLAARPMAFMKQKKSSNKTNQRLDRCHRRSASEAFHGGIIAIKL